MAGPTGPATFAPRCGRHGARPTSTGSIHDLPWVPRPDLIPWEAGTARRSGSGPGSRCRDAARVRAGDHPAFAANRRGQQPPKLGRPRPRSRRPNSGDVPATRQLDPDRMEVTPSCREHQLEHPTEISRAAQPRRHGRERAERGGQGTNLGRVRDCDAAREDLTEVARGVAGHEPVHLLGGRTERHARRRARGGSRPRGVAGIRRGRVPGTAGRRAAARCQHDHSADGDHGQHPMYGRAQRPAPPVSCTYRLAMTHHRSLPSLSPACQGSCAPAPPPSSPGLSARRGPRAGRFEPRGRSRLQDWTGQSPPRFPRVGQSHRSGSLGARGGMRRSPHDAASGPGDAGFFTSSPPGRQAWVWHPVPGGLLHRRGGGGLRLHVLRIDPAGDDPG